jgi:hypothetical protein
MVEQVPAVKIEAIASRIGSVVGTVASVLGLGVSIVQRTSSSPNMTGGTKLDVILHVAIASAIVYGVLWGTADHWIAHWGYDAGGQYKMPTGGRAIVLSLSLTIPLALVPFLYQRITRTSLLILPGHWTAILFVIVLGAVAHLIMYGTKSDGIRQWLSPAGEYPSMGRGILIEGLYTAIYFSFIVLPYRLIVSPGDSLAGLLVSRLLLPSLVFFLSMTLFIAFLYPSSLNDKGWVQVRGVISGMVMMLCFCAGMFL